MKTYWRENCRLQLLNFSALEKTVLIHMMAHCLTLQKKKCCCMAYLGDTVLSEIRWGIFHDSTSTRHLLSHFCLQKCRAELWFPGTREGYWPRALPPPCPPGAKFISQGESSFQRSLCCHNPNQLQGKRTYKATKRTVHLMLIALTTIRKFCLKPDLLVCACHAH